MEVFTNSDFVGDQNDWKVRLGTWCCGMELMSLGHQKTEYSCFIFYGSRVHGSCSLFLSSYVDSRYS